MTSKIVSRCLSLSAMRTPALILFSSAFSASPRRPFCTIGWFLLSLPIGGCLPPPSRLVIAFSATFDTQLRHGTLEVGEPIIRYSSLGRPTASSPGIALRRTQPRILVPSPASADAFLSVEKLELARALQPGPSRHRQSPSPRASAPTCSDGRDEPTRRPLFEGDSNPRIGASASGRDRPTRHP